MANKSTRSIVAVMMPVVRLISHLSVADRIALLSGVLAQEICNLPASERPGETDRVSRELSDWVKVTEREMREALIQNARDGI